MTPAILPWPRRMKAPLAAAYCGISKTKFSRGLGKTVMSVKDGANRLWYIEDLDAALDAAKQRQSSPGNDFAGALEDVCGST